MSRIHVDYDRIAPDFDNRYQADRLAGVEQSLLGLIQSKSICRVLEVGCGTGRWLQSIAPLPSEGFGIDLSSGMLSKAKQKLEKNQLACGRAECLPFADRSFDFIFCVNAFHHFDDPQYFLAEVVRVLSQNGVLAIVGQVPQDRKNRWYVYDYFESTYETDLQRFQPWGAVLDWMIAAGYENVSWNPVEYIVDHKVGWQIFDDPFLQKNAVSQLALLSDTKYQAGLKKIKDTLRKSDARGEEIIFQTELRLDMLLGHKIDKETQ